MTTGKIFTKWDETHSELWSHQPIRLEHEMHKSPAFSMDDLAQADRELSARALQPGQDRRQGLQPGVARRRYRQSLAAGR